MSIDLEQFEPVIEHIIGPDFPAERAWEFIAKGVENLRRKLLQMSRDYPEINRGADGAGWDDIIEDWRAEEFTA